MITVICLWWLGTELEAKTWYFALLFIGVCFRIFNAYRSTKFESKVKAFLRELKDEKEDSEESSFDKEYEQKIIDEWCQEFEKRFRALRDNHGESE